VISCDPAEYASKAALAIGGLIGGKGTVALTQGGFNPTENRVADTIRKTMSEKYPDVKVLPSEIEGFDLSAAASKAASIIQANPGLTAALSTTGGGASAWAQALRDSGRKIFVIGMDYTRINLDLVKSGEVYAVIGQPLWDESFGAAELLDKALRGEKLPAWTRLEAPLITKENLEPFQKLMDKVESVVRR
jgi:ribose transport system substrate-binding protein